MSRTWRKRSREVSSARCRSSLLRRSGRDQDVLAELRAEVSECLGDDHGLLIVDETGFLKKGQQSVGVARQYSGTLGRIDNCQVGVFVSYCSSQGETLIDRRLFLPEEWTSDPERCRLAGIPGERHLFGPNRN